MSIIGAHVFEVAFVTPRRCVCPKCQHAGPAQLREKHELLAIRDLDVLGSPSFWTYQPILHQCPRCRQRTQVPTPFRRLHVMYTYRFEQCVLEQLVGSSVEDVARAERSSRRDFGKNVRS